MLGGAIRIRHNVCMPSSRSPLRALRGAIAATVATAVALLGHVLGGGEVPGWLGVVLPWWLSVTVCTVLAGSRFSLPRMGAAVLTSQALFHGLFMAGTPGDATSTLVAPPGSHLGHGAAHGHGSLGDGVPAVHVHGAGAADGLTGVEHHLHAAHLDTQMLLGHLVAALVTTLLLHRGETMLFRCLGFARLALSFLCPAVDLRPLGRFVPPTSVPAVPDADHLPHTQRAQLAPRQLRGPPLVLAA